MIVRMNDREIVTFSGALVKNALLKYSQEDYRAVLNGEKKVVDKNGNTVDLEGELSTGSNLYIKDDF